MDIYCGQIETIREMYADLGTSVASHTEQVHLILVSLSLIQRILAR